MAEAISEGKDVHSLKKSCNVLPNVIIHHIGSVGIADLFSKNFNNCIIQLYLMKII